MDKNKFQPLNFTRLSEEEMVQCAREFYTSMKARRTVRDFSPEPIPREVIENALLAAGTAPNGANKQPWHFVVVTDPSTKKQIRHAAEQVEQAFYEERAPEEWLNDLRPLGTDAQKPFLELAPALIAIFVKSVEVDDDGTQHTNYYPTESVGIATGMLITALHLSGLATLTYTPSPMRFLNNILGRPDTERPFLILVTGYPAPGTSVPTITKKTLEDIASFR